MNTGVVQWRISDSPTIHDDTPEGKTAVELNEWFATGVFDANPYGVPYDPEELGARLDAGEDPDAVNRPHPDHTTWLADQMRPKS